MRWLSDCYTTRFSSPPDLNLFYKTNASWIIPFHCVYHRPPATKAPSPSSTLAKICSILIPLPRKIPPSRKGRKDLFYPYPFTTNNPRQVAKAAKIPQRIFIPIDVSFCSPCGLCEGFQSLLQTAWCSRFVQYPRYLREVIFCRFCRSVLTQILLTSLIFLRWFFVSNYINLLGKSLMVVSVNDCQISKWIGL